jgi:competence protein ComK
MNYECYDYFKLKGVIFLKEELIQEYEINPRTMLIEPVFYGSKVYSRIYENEDVFLAPYKPIDIIKLSCEYFGAGYEGRKKGTKRLIGKTHKAPIAIDPMTSIFFFPTTSPSNPNCIWVADGHVLKHLRDSSQVTNLIFRNRFSIKIPVSEGSFGNQLLRTSLLRAKFIQVNNEAERKAYFYMQNLTYMSDIAEDKDDYPNNKFNSNKTSI